MADFGWLFAWAKENGIECPYKDGAADIPKLLRLYNESRAKSGRKEYRLNESDGKTAYVRATTLRNRRRGCRLFKAAEESSPQRQKSQSLKRRRASTDWRQSTISAMPKRWGSKTQRSTKGRRSSFSIAIKASCIIVKNGGSFIGMM